MNKTKNKKQAVETGLDAALDKCVKVASQAHISETDLVVKILGRLHEVETKNKIDARFKNGKPMFNGDAGP
ncbi:MAG: hypothetical protein SFY67_03685 [Candidatus Melainabacteria bacterium]|nr:hypothetical protein [Candidatus Melainabacteria bacterium]